MEFTITARGEGLEVHESTESFESVDPKTIAEALKAFDTRKVLAVGASAGGPVFVRVKGA